MSNSAPTPLEVFELHDKELDFDAYISIDTLRNGLAFGGCRFASNVTKEEVMQLAQCMTWKLCAHNLPVGGAKGGVRVDPHNPHIKEILRRFAVAAKEILSSKVLLGKDLGATSEIVDSMYESIHIPQLHLLKRRPSSENVPDRLRDFAGYQNHMTALGVAWSADTAFKGDAYGKTAIIQGFGAVGLGSVVRLARIGVRVLGISDARIGVYNKAGFPTEVLLEAGKAGVLDGTSRGLPYKHEVVESNKLLCREADIVVLAAASNSVSKELAMKISAQTVIEGSNFGLCPDARQVLFDRGVLVVPDVLANSTSAALVAHQMASLNTYSHDRLWNKIERSITSSVQTCMEIAKSEKIDIRDAYTNFLVPKVLKSVNLT
jgi:glutamate dehydrogenase (NAD(P)+)